jgi:hypothetical protein
MKQTTDRLHNLCLASFVVAFTSLFLSHLQSSGAADNGYFALPAPGLESVVEYRALKPGSYQIWAEIASRMENSVGIPDNLPPVPCDFEIRAIASSGSSVVARSRLRFGGEYPYGRIYDYGSDPFALNSGAYSIDVKNIGCDKGYAFQGGMAYFGFQEPKHIPLPSFLQLLAFASACTGFGGLLVLAGRLVARR